MRQNQRGIQLSLLALAAGFIALGSFQGARIDRMREMERFYRWTLTAATFSAFGESLEHEKAAGEEPLDDELFAEIVAHADRALPDTVPQDEEDVDGDGTLRSKLARAARHGLDADIYAMLAGADAAPLAAKFGQYTVDKKLVSLGTQFAASEMYQKDSQGEDVGLTSLFFGFRKLAANFIWMQVDTAWHAGQMHRLLPMMRTTVALDPNFVDAYLLGAWHLAYNITARLPETPEPQKQFHPKYLRRLGAKEEWFYVATDFLKDGIRKNPRDFRLYSDLGYAVYETKLKDHANAVKYLTEARRYKHDQWVPRMLCLSLWRNGQYDEAIRGWEEYLKRFPDSLQAKRFIPINQAYLAEAKCDQARECASAAKAAAAKFAAQAAEAEARGDAAGAQPLRAQAQAAESTAAEMERMGAEEWTKAAEIYRRILAGDPEDVVASARLGRRQALDLRREGRYSEAAAYLDVARNQFLESFDEFSDLIIDIKLEGGLPLSISEQYAIERRREAAAYAKADTPKPKRFVACDYALPEKADAPAVAGDAASPQ